MTDAINSPAPWSCSYGPHPGRWNIFAGTHHIGTFYAGSKRGLKRTEADVNAMTAAPLLLDALRRALDELKTARAITHDAEYIEILNHRIADAEAAIDAATR
jgi:hypothetical protein